MLTAIAFFGAAGLGAAVRGVIATTMWRVVGLNVIGSFVLGLLSDLAEPMFTIVAVGAIGSLTTFSTFVGHLGQGGSPLPLDDAPIASNQAHQTSTSALVAFAGIGTLGCVAAATAGIALAI